MHVYSMLVTLPHHQACSYYREMDIQVMNNIQNSTSLSGHQVNFNTTHFHKTDP